MISEGFSRKLTVSVVNDMDFNWSKKAIYFINTNGGLYTNNKNWLTQWMLNKEFTREEIVYGFKYTSYFLRNNNNYMCEGC